MPPKELAHGDVAPRVACFFACYPQPLALRRDGSHIVHFGGDLRGYSGLAEVVLHYERGMPYLSLDPRLAFDPFVSVRFHRGQRRYSSITQNSEDLLGVVRQIAPDLAASHDQEPPVADADDEWAAYTVVEMVTPLIRPAGDDLWVPAPPTHDFMGPNLTRCIDGLRQLVTAYRLTEGLAIPAPARERVGPFVLGETRPADPAVGGWDGDGAMVINAFATAGQHPMPRPPGPESEALMLNFLQQRYVDHPMIAFQELQADAQTALDQYGDFRSAVMLTYTASEVLLDAALMALAWEEGMQPEQAAELFSPRLLTRVRTCYHDRIGGSWTPDKPRSVLGKWREACVLLRHQVAHAGVVPEREAADEAIEAFRNLRGHVLNRLCASLNRYPQSAALLVSEEGMKRRNAWTKRAREAKARTTFDTFMEFNHWCDGVLALRNATAG